MPLPLLLSWSCQVIADGGSWAGKDVHVLLALSVQDVLLLPLKLSLIHVVLLLIRDVGLDDDLILLPLLRAELDDEKKGDEDEESDTDSRNQDKERVNLLFLLCLLRDSHNHLFILVLRHLHILELVLDWILDGRGGGFCRLGYDVLVGRLGGLNGLRWRSGSWLRSFGRQTVPKIGPVTNDSIRVSVW